MKGMFPVEMSSQAPSPSELEEVIFWANILCFFTMDLDKQGTGQSALGEHSGSVLGSGEPFQLSWDVCKYLDSKGRASVNPELAGLGLNAVRPLSR